MKVWTCVSPSDIIIWCIDPLLVRDVIRRQIRRPLIPGIASPYIILLFLIVLWYHSSYTSNIAYSNENCMDNCLASCYATLFNKTKLHAISAEKNIYNLKPLILQLFLMSHAWQIWEYVFTHFCCILKSNVLMQSVCIPQPVLNTEAGATSPPFCRQASCAK